MQNRWAAGFICILSCENADFAQGTPSGPNVSWCKAVGGIAYEMYWTTVSCSSWVLFLASPVYPNKAFCDGFHQIASFLALDTRESCSHNYTQRGRSGCYSSVCSWRESSAELPELFGGCTLVLACGGCRVGISAAAEGTALAESLVKGEPTSLVSGQWRSLEENKKEWDTLLLVAKK